LQLWTLYENGELVNGANRLCLDVNETEGGHGETWMNACEDKRKQMWTLYPEGDSFFLINKQDSTACLGARGPTDTAWSEACNWTAS